MPRALAHVERVVSVEPIPNADRIEVVTVLGWHCVTKKGEVSVGDMVVYFEIDSFLPVESRYEFLRQSSFKKMSIDDGNGNITTIEGFRLKTVKLRGQVSQGLVLPLSEFPEFDNDVKEGDDLTDVLGIHLYEKPVPANMRGAIKGGFPSAIKKTDQERIQNHPEYFELYRDVEFEVTEKIDGTSGTEFLDDDESLNVCSRNLNLKEGGTVYWDVVKRSGIGDFLSTVGKRYAVQNEIAGEGINKNPLGIKGQCLFIFDVWDREEQRHLTTSERFALLTPYFDGDSSILKHVPVISSSFKPFTEYSSIDELIASAGGQSLVNPSRKREGLVFKSCQLVDGQILSFKIVDNQLLLKEKDDAPRDDDEPHQM